MKWLWSFLVLICATCAVAEVKPGGALPGAERIVRPIRLAIAGFAPASAEPHLLQRSEALVDLLTSQLSGAPQFDLVERQDVDRIVGELALMLPQGGKPKDAIRIGRILNADWLLLGVMPAEGANRMAVKIVDAHTGIIRDLAIIPLGADMARVAELIVGFVQNSVRNQSRNDQRVVLAIGGFEDLSVNDKFAGFGRVLRSSLEQSYLGTRVSVVERSMMDPLQKELQLNLAGLTQRGEAVKQAQPALLLVDGMFRVFQDDEFKINLILRIERVGGEAQLLSFKEVPGKILDNKIISAIDAALKEVPRQPPAGSSRAEAHLQFKRGKALSSLHSIDDNDTWLGGYTLDQNKERRQKNIQEAISAFEAALLLEPEWWEAKMYAAICLDAPDIERPDLARDYYQEVMAGSADPKLVGLARTRYLRSYFGRDDEYALKLIAAQAESATNLETRVTFLVLLQTPVENLFQKGRMTTDERLEYLKREAFASLELDELRAGAGKEFMRAWRIHDYFNEIYFTLGHDQAAAAAYLDHLVPVMTKTFPSMELYLIGTHFVWLPKEAPFNSARLETLMKVLQSQPEAIRAQKNWNRSFFMDLMEHCLWRERYDLAETAAVILEKLDDRLAEAAIVNRRHAYLAYCHQEQGQWGKAAEEFEALGDCKLVFGLPGPWGKAPFAFNAKEAALACRQHFGGSPLTHLRESDPVKADPLKIVLQKPILTLGKSIVFACDGETVWLADGMVLFSYNQREARLDGIDLPESVQRNITCICVGEDKVWFGTAGSGLIELDKASKNVLVHQDNLLLPNITALHLTDQRLWIGYGREHAGGVGYLDLTSKKIYGLTPELTTETMRSGS
ncbi:MAG: hypothetical protein JWR69_754, partial [Pedosphaera sp.]|nr:hypothetical protein [Pedosphaera sp.]